MSKKLFINREEELVLESEGEVKEYLLDRINYSNSGFQYWLDDRYTASEILEDIEDYCKSSEDFIEEYIEECFEDLMEDYDIEERELSEEVLRIKARFESYEVKNGSIYLEDFINTFNSNVKYQIKAFDYERLEIIEEDSIEGFEEARVFNVEIEEDIIVIYVN